MPTIFMCIFVSNNTILLDLLPISLKSLSLDEKLHVFSMIFESWKHGNLFEMKLHNDQSNFQWKHSLCTQHLFWFKQCDSYLARTHINSTHITIVVEVRCSVMRFGCAAFTRRMDLWIWWKWWYFITYCYLANLL